DEALYQFGLEICLLANKVNFNLGKVKYLSKKITETYENLPVKSELDLALTSNDILNVLNKKPGAWFGQLKKEMVLEILGKRLKNTKEDLIKYLESKKV